MRWGRGDQCQILDKGGLPVYELGASYISESDFQGGSDSAIFEVSGNWDCGYFHDFIGGDLSLDIGFNSVFFVKSAGLGLPHNVSELSLDLAWVRRMQSGMGLIIGLTPGLYSDFEKLNGDGFFVPIRAVAVKSFNSSISGKAGLDIRFGWDREIMPVLGFEWQPARSFRMELAMPESLIRITPSEDWSFYGKCTWRNTSYALRERRGDSREQLTMEDFAAFFGLQIMVDEQAGIIAEVGRLFHRTVAFEYRDSSSRKHDIDDALAVRLAIAGYF